jgi:hypothetical protein
MMHDRLESIAAEIDVKEECGDQLGCCLSSFLSSRLSDQAEYPLGALFIESRTQVRQVPQSCHELAV